MRTLSRGWDLVYSVTSQAHEAWISFPPPPFLYYPPLFWIIRVFCVHSFCISRKTVDTEYTYYSWCMTSTDIVKWRKNEWLWKFWKKGGSREKGGRGNEIHAPCACGLYTLYYIYVLECLLFFLCNINHCNGSASCWDLDWTIQSYLILSLYMWVSVCTFMCTYISFPARVCLHHNYWYFTANI